MSYPYDAIIFDFDGVLVESVQIKTNAFAALYAPYGQEIVDKVMKDHVEWGGLSRYVKIKKYHQDFLGVGLTESELEKLAQQFSEQVLEAVIKCPWVLGAKTFLDEQHKNFLCYVASGTPTAELKTIIQRRGMEHYFCGVYGSPERKSDIILRILREKNIPCDRVLMIGDSIEDFEAAQIAHVHFIGRETDYFSPRPGYSFVSNFLDLRVCGKSISPFAKGGRHVRSA